jgi:hypothetical protein
MGDLALGAAVLRLQDMTPDQIAEAQRPGFTRNTVHHQADDDTPQFPRRQNGTRRRRGPQAHMRRLSPGLGSLGLAWISWSALGFPWIFFGFTWLSLA